MNNPLELTNELVAEAFADYRKNQAYRIDEVTEAKAHDQGARVGVSRKHESAHLHVAGEAAYIDDLPEPAGLLHVYLGTSAKAHARITSMDLEPVRQAPGVGAIADLVVVLHKADKGVRR